jgi:hypothetical protein
MTLEIEKVWNRDDLFSALRGTDISVPPRNEGRTTAHRETYNICHLLSTLARVDELTFPISARQQDRPDVLISTGNTEIGIEITEAIPQQFAAFCAFVNREYPGHWLPAIHFPWDAPHLTDYDKVRELLRKRAVACSGWMADEPEREWADFILSVIDRKLKSLAEPDFGKHDRNWLSICDNLPLPMVHLAQAVIILRPLLRDRWFCHPGFDAVFVEHGSEIVKLTATQSTRFCVNNLWSVR